MRTAFVLVSASLLGLAAEAQVPIQWSSNLDRSFTNAQRSLRPLLFYVPATNAGAEDDLDDAQQRVFRDPLIVGLVGERFVPVRVSRSTTSLPFLRSVGAPTLYGGYLLVVAPSGEPVGVIGPAAAANPSALARALTARFREYRTALFKDQYQELLEDPGAAPAAIERALRVVREFIITAADDSVLKLLQRRNLPANLRTVAYETLAILSTPRSIDALFTAARSRQQPAVRALARATPAAIERLLPELELDNEPGRLATAYSAVAAIARVPNPRPARFWNSDNERVKERELERVRAGAESALQAWAAQPTTELR
ncbi:MAG: ERAP1-like C-terminal domain-containing protein [Planctomycetota bacterium]